MVMLSTVVIQVGTGLVGSWHGTLALALALALVKDVVEAKGFRGIFLVEVGLHTHKHWANIGPTITQTEVVSLEMCSF